MQIWPLVLYINQPLRCTDNAICGAWGMCVCGSVSRHDFLQNSTATTFILSSSDLWPLTLRLFIPPFTQLACTQSHCDVRKVPPLHTRFLRHQFKCNVPSDFGHFGPSVFFLLCFNLCSSLLILLFTCGPGGIILSYICIVTKRNSL